MGWSFVSGVHLVVCLLFTAGSEPPGLTQDTLNYMAKYLQVKYDNIDNLQSKRAQLTFFNSGAHTVPGR